MPDLFLYAADKLQADVSDFLVVEDSVVGTNAAKAANMQVIGFLDGMHAKNVWCRSCITEAKPDFIAEDANELLGFLVKS